MKKALLILLIVFAVLGVVLFFLMRPYYVLVTDTMRISPIKSLLRLGAPTSIGQKTNILLLGIGGGTHDGPNLTDSITVISYDRSSNTVRSLGIPRDIWSDALQEKINAAYAIGESIDEGRGLPLAAAETSSLTGVPIHYTVVVAFDGFKKIIDYVGGIDVDVQTGFTDREFPIQGRENDLCGGDDPDYKCRYETISFDKGVQHMDGATALKFVRSRHAEGDQGSDFARSARQQQVMSALRAHILAPDFLRDSERVKGLYQLVDEMIVRNISNQQASVMMRDVVLGGDFKQVTKALPDEMFEVPDPYVYGKYVLIPKDGSGDAIRTTIRDYLGIPLN